MNTANIANPIAISVKLNGNMDRLVLYKACRTITANMLSLVFLNNHTMIKRNITTEKNCTATKPTLGYVKYQNGKCQSAQN